MLRHAPLAVLTLLACAAPDKSAAYLDNAGRDDLLSGGVKLIPIQTPKGQFSVWTKRVGNNPTIKLLLLHGGPGATHEYFEAFDSYFPAAGIEYYYYYDQLGSYYSDQPDEPDLWETPRFVEEVEQVRQALGLDQSNFYLLGHSWGGILGMRAPGRTVATVGAMAGRQHATFATVATFATAATVTTVRLPRPPDPLVS
jgi:proline iminopeptidase